jgi:hypothetical protein
MKNYESMFHARHVMISHASEYSRLWFPLSVNVSLMFLLG